MNVDLHVYANSALRWPGDFTDHAQTLLAPLQELVYSCYVEHRLGAHASQQTDLLVSFVPSVAPQLRELARSRRGAPWRAIERICDAWQTGRCVGMLWLEFDHVERDASASPSVHTCLIHDYRTDTSLPPIGFGLAASVRPAAPVHGLSGDQTAQLTRELGTHLGEAASAPMCSTLARIASQAPAGTHFIHLSSMLGRERPTLKLYARVPQAELLDWLERCAWLGNREQGETMLATLFPPSCTEGELFVDLTVDADALVSVGLALPQQYVRDGRDDRGPMLGRLVDARLCTTTQLRQIATWTGRALEDGPRPMIERRWLDLKLVWCPQGELTAKAYLGLRRSHASPFEYMAAYSELSQRRSEGTCSSAPLSRHQ